MTDEQIKELFDTVPAFADSCIESLRPASVFRDVAFAVMKAETHEGGTELFEVQVVLRIHRKQPDVFPHLFALIEEFPPCHAGIVGIDCPTDQAGVYRS